MKELSTLLRPQGIMLLSIPVGIDCVDISMQRIYGENRLPILLKDFSIIEDTYWMENVLHIWMPCEKKDVFPSSASKAADKQNKNRRTLGCFVLRKK